MADTGKKRKRHSDSREKPSKKVAIEPSTPISNVSISVIPNEDQWAPVVASTPGLQVEDSIALNIYKKRRNNASSRPGINGDIATRELLLQSSEHPHVDYIGREEEAGGVDSLMKHYIGVYDPATGSLEVVEARRMTIRGVVRSQQATSEALAEKADHKNMRDLRNNLGQTFGTKKARKAIASLTENAISPMKTSSQLSQSGPQRHDVATKTMLAAMAEASQGMATRDELQAMIDEGMPRPKANLEAENVRDVYTAETLIGDDILKKIPFKDWQNAASAKKEILIASKFAAHRMRKIVTDITKLRVLRYLVYVLAFFRATRPKSKTMRRVPGKQELQAALQDIPEVVLENIKRKFSVGVEMKKFHIDLLITNVCALALLVDEFSVDIMDLREDLQLEIKELSIYFHEVGARVVKASPAEQKALGLDKAAGSQRKLAKLKLPLDFPKARVATRKKRA